MKLLYQLIALLVIIGASCSMPSDEIEQVKWTVLRYNELLSEGYRKLNMNPMQEVATEDQARKLYYHMSAIGEGKLRMESTLKRLEFRNMEFAENGDAMIETREIWDFAHKFINTEKIYAEEKNFMYEMVYHLKKQKRRWIVTNVLVVSGASTASAFPWPHSKQKKGRPPVAEQRLQ
jgi:hypothetical protein